CTAMQRALDEESDDTLLQSEHAPTLYVGYGRYERGGDERRDRGQHSVTSRLCSSIPLRDTRERARSCAHSAPRTRLSSITHTSSSPAPPSAAPRARCRSLRRLRSRCLWPSTSLRRDCR